MPVINPAFPVTLPILSPPRVQEGPTSRCPSSQSGFPVPRAEFPTVTLTALVERGPSQGRACSPPFRPPRDMRSSAKLTGTTSFSRKLQIPQGIQDRSSEYSHVPLITAKCVVRRCCGHCAHSTGRLHEPGRHRPLAAHAGWAGEPGAPGPPAWAACYWTEQHKMQSSTREKDKIKRLGNGRCRRLLPA